MGARLNILLTVTPFFDYASSIPHEYVSRHLARQLIKDGHDVRVLAEESVSHGWPDEVEIVKGDIRKPSETPEMFKGIDAVFLAGAVPETIYEAMEMAKEADVKKIVNLSSHGPEIEVMFTPDSWYWLAVEVIVERSGINYAHVIPSGIMALTLVGDSYSGGKSWAERIKNDVMIQELDVDAKYAYLHEEDLAIVAAKELQDVSTTGKRVHVNGPLMSDKERAQHISTVLGREVAFKKLVPEDAMAYYGTMGVDEAEIAEMLEYSAPSEEEQLQVDPEIERIIGRPLKTYDQWAREHKDDFIA